MILAGLLFVLGRNLIKLFVLALPPLVLLTFINPYAQSVHDVFAQTVVVGRADEEDAYGEHVVVVAPEVVGL